MRQPGTVFLDTETTGLDHTDEIIDIAIVDREGQVLLDTLVRPTVPISDEAYALHGLDHASLASAPTWPDVYPEVASILAQRGPVVVYNADFDSRILNQVNRRHGLPEVQAEWHCAMKQYAAFAGVWHPKHETFRWYKLTDALRMSNRFVDGDAHRALTDAEACRQVVESIAAESLAPAPAIWEAQDFESGTSWAPGAKTRTFPGGRVTVVSSSRGCSTTVLIVIIAVLGLCVLMACCALLFVALGG